MRRGTTVVEAIATLATVLFLLFIALDFGLAVHRWNTLSEAARRLARAVIIHGAMADDSWGIAAVAGHAGDGSIYATELRPVLGASEGSAVRFNIEWLDSANELDDEIQVSLLQQYEPIVPWLGDSMELRAATVMKIVH